MVLSNHSSIFFLTKAFWVCLLFLSTSKKLMWSSGRESFKAYLHCIFCWVKQWIHGEKYHTIKPRCANLWIWGGYPNSVMLFETHLSLLLRLWRNLLWEHGLFFSFFSCLFFLSSFFYDSPMSLFTTKLLRERDHTYLEHLFLIDPNQDIFLVDPKWKVCLAPTPSVGVVQVFGGLYVILVLKAW